MRRRTTGFDMSSLLLSNTVDATLALTEEQKDN